MTISMKTLLAGAAIASALAVAAPVSAATIVVAYTGGPFSLANPVGTLPATVLTKGNDYDFTFTLTAPIVGSTVSVQALAQSQNPVQAQLILYQLYSGTPGSGTLIGVSSQDFSPVVGFNGDVGDYYIEVTSAEIAKSGEVASGSVNINSVPEPASWAMMLVGFGALGVAMRRRSAKALAA